MVNCINKCYILGLQYIQIFLQRLLYKILEVIFFFIIVYPQFLKQSIDVKWDLDTVLETDPHSFLWNESF